VPADFRFELYYDICDPDIEGSRPQPWHLWKSKEERDPGESGTKALEALYVSGLFKAAKALWVVGQQSCPGSGGCDEYPEPGELASARTRGVVSWLRLQGWVPEEGKARANDGFGLQFAPRTGALACDRPEKEKPLDKAVVQRVSLIFFFE
jgi:hypothetical protein